MASFVGGGDCLFGVVLDGGGAKKRMDPPCQ